MSAPFKPQFYIREVLGPGNGYIRKVLGSDGVYRDAPLIIVPPDILAARRAFAERYIVEAKAALLGKLQTRLIQ